MSTQVKKKNGGGGLRPLFGSSLFHEVRALKSLPSFLLNCTHIDQSSSIVSKNSTWYRPQPILSRSQGEIVNFRVNVRAGKMCDGKRVEYKGKMHWNKACTSAYTVHVQPYARVYQKRRLDHKLHWPAIPRRELRTREALFVPL